jgi:hypothetical protein
MISRAAPAMSNTYRRSGGRRCDTRQAPTCNTDAPTVAITKTMT